MFIPLRKKPYTLTKPNNNNPFPVKLGDDLKPFLQMEAVQTNKSLHFLIKQILKEWKAGRENLTLHNVS